MPAVARHYSRYVLKQLAVGTTVVSAALLFIVWLTQSLRFLQFVMGKGLPIATWLKLTVLMLPPTLSLILPIALFAVVVFVYNRLAVDRELVVLQSAGLSRLGLARPALVIGFGATILGYMLSLAAVPASMRAFKDLQWSIRNDVSQVLLREGTFNQLSPGLTVYVRDRDANGSLLGVMIQDSRTTGQAVTLMAKRGSVGSSDEGPVIHLDDGSRQERGTGDSYTVLTFDTYTVGLGELAGAGEDRWLDNGERSTGDLLSLGESDGHSETTVRRMRADAHSRLSAPILNVAFALIAVAWLLLGDFDRHGVGRRILGATTTIVAIEVATLGAFALAARREIWSLALYVLALGPAMVAIRALINFAPPRGGANDAYVPPQTRVAGP